ncbi:MAG: ribbon-helix-helix protein, CopG family [Selenomonadaceae bacterium]|nr:ribbon-helix-helix protein, CopG family [Selenomonadaceae bacterium]
MTVTIQIDEAETEIIQKYAAENHLTLSELFRLAVIEKIEDEEEATRLYEQAMEDYKKNPTTYKLVPVVK